MTYIRTLLCTWTWSKHLEEGGETLRASYSLSSLVQLAPPPASRNCVPPVSGSAESFLPSFLPSFICIVMGLKVPFGTPSLHCPWSACSSTSCSLPLPPHMGGTHWQTLLGAAADYSCLLVLQNHAGSVWTEHHHRNQVCPWKRCWIF